MPTAKKARRLHLIDLENLVGCPRPTDFEVSECRDRYSDLVGTDGPDQVIIACNHGALLSVGCGWPHARHLVRSGPDGADLALLDVIDGERIEERFDEVVIGSGDGIFAMSVVSLQRHGVPVTVVASPGSLSNRLRLAATRVVPFIESTPPTPEAGVTPELEVHATSPLRKVA